MPSNAVRFIICIYCGAEFIAVKLDDIHTKANKYKIKRWGSLDAVVCGGFKAFAKKGIKFDIIYRVHQLVQLMEQ